MRRFSDSASHRWEVVVGRESWGGLVAIFIPCDGLDGFREAPLRAAGYEEGLAELERMSEDALQRLLGGSTPKAMAE